MNLLYGFELKLNEYMGIGIQGILFVCVVLYFMYKKEKSVHIKLYITYVAVLVVVMANPLSLYVLDKTGNMEVYERFFWLLMTTFFISIAFVDLLRKKGSFLVPCLLLLFLGGESVFTDVEYVKAQNAEKIRREAIEVSDMIMRDFEGLGENDEVIPNRMGVKSPRAVVPEPINEDIRMYNANIELWYVRENFGDYNRKAYKELSHLMVRENPDVPAEILFSNMKKKNFQYFVLGNWQELSGDLSGYDISLVGQTESYRVYKYTEEQMFTLRQYADVEGFQCMSYMIENSRGGLVVVDGGRAWQSLDLVEQIKKRGGVVDTWIITHAHDDHAGVLASVLEAEWHKSEIEIKEILIGDMDYEAVMTQGGGRTDMVGYLQMGLEKHDNVRVLRAGDELDVIGLHMKVLHTCNRTVVENSDNILNDGSMVFTLEGEKRRVMFLSDTADRSRELAEEITDLSQGSKIGRLIADEILANYPEDVKCWAVQMSHHGNGSYPDYFYEAISPKYAFFDAPDWLMQNRDKETGQESYYSTPHYVQLMERLGAKIISYDSEKQWLKFR